MMSGDQFISRVTLTFLDRDLHEPPLQTEAVIQLSAHPRSICGPGHMVWGRLRKRGKHN